MEAQKKKARSALGRGLSALVSSKPVALETESTSFLKGNAPSEEIGDNQTQFIGIEQLCNNPQQPRQSFSENEIRELCDSIKTLGVLQPILVRPIASPKEEPRYEIVAGERRWRAAKLAELKRVPVIVQQIDDKQAFEIALVENIQRQDLNPVEEALAYQKLVEGFQLSQAEVAERVGKDRATVANLLRILKLPAEVLDMLKSDTLSLGHAKIILSVREPGAQLSLAKKVIKESLSVRQLEQIVSRVVVLDSGRRLAKNQGKSTEEDEVVPAIIFQDVIDRMRNTLATKVSIKHHKSGRGRVEIEYFSEQELDRIIEHICSANALR